MISKLSNGDTYTVCISFAALAVASLYISRRRLVKLLYDIVVKSGGKKSGKPYLSNNFGPVRSEGHWENVPVEGTIPEELDGAFLRNGPNPLLDPTANYHWFDGDGMIHATRFGPEGVSYCNHLVKTSRLEQEKAAGQPLFFRLGDLYGLSGVVMTWFMPWLPRMGVIDTSNGDGVANTALVYHAKQILALHEGDLPYMIRLLCNGLVETVGRQTFSKKWTGAFTAHPKLDPVTGELAAIGYDVVQPFVRAGIIDPNGNVKRQWEVKTPFTTSMMHDMLLTEHHIVLLNTSIIMDGEYMVKKNRLPFRFAPEKNAQFGLVSRDSPEGKPEVRWFDTGRPFVIIHSINAWEEDGGNIVKLYACEMSTISLDLESVADSERARPTEYTLDMKTGAVTSRQITALAGDFPVVHPMCVSRPSRYAYAATFSDEPVTVKFNGIAKLDLRAPLGTDACIARVNYPDSIKSGEAIFVPRKQGVFPSPEDEDDGFLMAYVHCEKRDVSFLHIYDAKTMDSKPLAVVTMPQRVPYGFHGTYVTGAELKKQMNIA